MLLNKVIKMEFFDVIKNRHSIRAFKNKEIEEEKLKKMLEVMNSAPSAGNLQAYETVVVRNEETKKMLAKAADQSFVGKAPVVIVVCANEKRSERLYGERGKNLYSMNDASIAAAYIELAAAALGLGSVWVGAFDDESVKKIIRMSEGINPIAIIPIGYPDEKLHATRRRKIEDIVHKETL